MKRLSDRERFILLNLVPGAGSTRLRRLLQAFGDLDRLWNADCHALQQVEGITPALAQHLAAARHHQARLEQELALAKRHGVTIITLEESAYPALLKAIPDPPLALYVQGTLERVDGVAVAVVGSRGASCYGLQCAERLGAELALRGVTVVSGLARGIDSAAHRGALMASGRTVAVLGSGLARIYPPEHGPLAERIAKQGAVLSEYPMDTLPLPYNFPRRNRIISGLSLGVVVVEAAAHSGALITVDCALEQGREVFAVPGPVTSTRSHGTHQLLKQGARLVSSVEDIVEELRLSPQPIAHAQTEEPAIDDAVRLPEPERRVLSCMGEHDPCPIDAISAQSGLAMPEVSSALLHLELKRLVQQLPGKRFVRRALGTAEARREVRCRVMHHQAQP
ncbi:MAG: DNA-protecting protein DprA [Candidatus Omnitrophica bacterium]|nr:DNA-protecting protein DprA [Candidatus Omnitrophota bacterium]